MKWYMKLIWTSLLVITVILVYCAGVYLWQTLEIAMDGEIHVSNADTIINVLLTYLITKDMIKDCLRLIYK